MDLAHLVVDAGVEEDPLGRRGLAGVDVGDDADVAIKLDGSGASHWSTLLGLALMAAILVTTFFTEAFRMTLVFGVPFLALLSALYLVFVRKPGRDCPIERATP
ncbi:hypothetical protein P797_16455 [Pseudomonas aeruginosa VRFPA04]|nr:hypothetical protein P797_16455 [Pseudomonas aeruginosa VRFPA04]